MLSLYLRHQLREMMLQQKIHLKHLSMFFLLLHLPRLLHHSFHRNLLLLHSHLLGCPYLPTCTLLVDPAPFLLLVPMLMRPS
uniref:Uncharacterized protein n=1 Tax=Rhizophora mucronata TaxID=61149 RepID=A0A2P2N4J6_RHIMU